MQALEKIVITTNWISIILVFLLSIIAVLKIIDSNKLKGYVFAVFNKGFIEDEVEENTSFFSSFYSLLLTWSGPEALPTLSVCKTDLTSSGVTIILLSCGLSLLKHALGMLAWQSFI